MISYRAVTGLVLSLLSAFGVLISFFLPWFETTDPVHNVSTQFTGSDLAFGLEKGTTLAQNQPLLTLVPAAMALVVVVVLLRLVRMDQGSYKVLTGVLLMLAGLVSVTVVGLSIGSGSSLLTADAANSGRFANSVHRLNECVAVYLSIAGSALVALGGMMSI